MAPEIKGRKEDLEITLRGCLLLIIGFGIILAVGFVSKEYTYIDLFVMYIRMALRVIHDSKY